MSGFSPPQECPKCGGRMQEGITDINREMLTHSHQAGTLALGPRVTLGGSPVWWALIAPQKPGPADKVLTGNSFQVLTNRCDQCGFLESYAP